MSRCPEEQRRQAGGRGRVVVLVLVARLGSLYVFFLTSLRQRCFLFPEVSGKCAVSITVRLILLQRRQGFCLEAWGYGATSAAL